MLTKKKNRIVYIFSFDERRAGERRRGKKVVLRWGANWLDFVSRLLLHLKTKFDHQAFWIWFCQVREHWFDNRQECNLLLGPKKLHNLSSFVVLSSTRSPAWTCARFSSIFRVFVRPVDVIIDAIVASTENKNFRQWLNNGEIWKVLSIHRSEAHVDDDWFRFKYTQHLTYTHRVL